MEVAAATFRHQIYRQSRQILNQLWVTLLIRRLLSPDRLKQRRRRNSRRRHRCRWRRRHYRHLRCRHRLSGPKQPLEKRRTRAHRGRHQQIINKEHIRAMNVAKYSTPTTI